jgi:hypothetical protein
VGNIHLRLVVVRTEAVRIVVDHIAVVGRIGVVRIAVAVVGGNHLVVGHIRLLRLWSLASHWAALKTTLPARASNIGSRIH